MSVSENKNSKNQLNTDELSTTVELRRKRLWRMIISAVFLATALVTKTFAAFNIPILGAGGMRVGLTGVFTSFPALLFGPVYGAVISGLSDLLGYLIKPDGAYIPWLTLTAAAGGFFKGLLWKFAMKHNIKITKAISISVLTICAVTGIAFHISLASDGVQSGLVAVQSELPTRGETEQMSLSPLSKAAVSLAKYNNDIITVNVIDFKGEELTLPENVEIDGHKTKITKIGENTFSGCTNLKTIFIGTNYTSIDITAFEALVKDVAIKVMPDSKAEEQLSESNLNIIVSEEKISGNTVSVSSDNFSDGVFSFKSSDTFRKYLARYSNFLTLGLESVAAAGLLIFFIDFLVRKLNKRYSKHQSVEFLRIFIAIGISGIAVTTLNTEILKNVMAQWNGRSFLILLVPRVIEEAIVCMIQAYIISILYGIFVTKILNKTSDIKKAVENK